MRTLLLLAGLLVVAPALAQAPTELRLVDPVLTVDGRRVVATGAPVTQIPFRVLLIEVPGDGTYTVSEHPFLGARRAGQFDGDGLYFAVRGRSVRLGSATPILSFPGPVTAYVAFTPSEARLARGLARIAVADDPNGRGRRSGGVSYAGARPLASTSASTLPELAERPAARYLRDVRLSHLRDDVDRIAEERARLAIERDQLVAARTAGRPLIVQASVTDRPVQQPALRADRDRLDAERRRLALERDQLARTYARVEAERDALADDARALRRRAEAAEAGATDRSSNAQLQAEIARLRQEVAARDGALDQLRDEQADRDARLAPVEAELARTRRLLADALHARDDARRDRDHAVRARDAATAEAARLRADLDRLEAELDALRVTGGSDAERRRLVTRLAAVEAERDALANERDRLRNEVDALRTELESHSTANRVPVPRIPAGAEHRTFDDPVPDPAEPAVSRTPRPTTGPAASLPGFDMGRLQNTDAVRQRLAAVAFPRSPASDGIEGDVLVLFETDASGRVVRSAVPAPLGGGFDAIAEDLVRGMRFEPPRVDGEPAPLRSQVLVRFQR